MEHLHRHRAWDLLLVLLVLLDQTHHLWALLGVLLDRRDRQRRHRDRESRRSHPEVCKQKLQRPGGIPDSRPKEQVERRLSKRYRAE